MDIIKVNKFQVQAGMEECAFEMNCILTRPQDKDALEDLNRATARYASLSTQLQILNQLEQQSQQAVQPPVQQQPEEPQEQADNEG